MKQAAENPTSVPPPLAPVNLVDEQSRTAEPVRVEPCGLYRPDQGTPRWYLHGIFA